MKKITKIESNPRDIANETKLRVAAYCRVSTDSEEQLISLETQKLHYDSFIKSKPDWEFAGIYYDEGISGTKKEKRAELLRLISDCENKKIDFIVTKSISRFARNTIDCLEIVRKLVDLGIFIYFEKENINTGSMENELMLTILSSLAESESVSISENSKWSIQRRFRNGTYKISYPPYGYDNIDGKMEINKQQAQVIKRIFADTLSGVSSHIIARALNNEAVPTKRGGNWTATTILGILRNEKYTGDLILQKTYTDDNFIRYKNNGEKGQYFVKDHHEAIISHEDFETAKLVIGQRAEEKGVVGGSNKYLKRYAFSGKIKCLECGSNFRRRIHGGKNNKYIAWGCPKHVASLEECSMLFIREDNIHQAFIVMMQKLIFGHKLILKPLLQKLKTGNTSDVFLQIQEIETKIEKNLEGQQTLTNLMTKGYLDAPLFNQQSNELRCEATRLKEKKEVLYHTINGGMAKVEDLVQLIKYVSKIKSFEAFDEEIFNQFVEKIIIISRAEIGFNLKCGITLKERMEG